MREHSSLFPLAATLAVAFAAVAVITFVPDLANAASDLPPGTQLTPPIPAPIPESDRKSGVASCACPKPQEKTWVRPKFAEAPPIAEHTALDETDEIAALESVQFALTEVGDGASYIWHRNNGRLSGMVQPLASFKSSGGQVCRHVVVILTSGLVSKKAEGVACRLANGQWQLEG